MRTLGLLVIGIAFSFSAWGETAAKPKKVTYRKTQEVNFDGSDVEGTVRSPDGAYLLQKQGVKFMPLYKVNKQFDKHIKESVEYLR